MPRIHGRAITAFSSPRIAGWETRNQPTRSSQVSNLYSCLWEAHDVASSQKVKQNVGMQMGKKVEFRTGTFVQLRADCSLEGFNPTSSSSTSGTYIGEHEELNQDEQWQERCLDQLRRSAPPSLSCTQHISLSSVALHIFLGFRAPPAFPKGGSLRQSSPERRQAQGGVVARTMALSKLPELSSNALSGCCKVCGRPEDEGKRFLICGHSLCMYRYYHIQCLTTKQIASKKQTAKPCWYCPSCLCRACLRDKDDDKIILCDGCDEGYHLYCLNPPRTLVPEGKWYCASCIAKNEKARDMRKFENEMLKRHRKDNDAMVQCGHLYGVELLLYAAKELGDEPPSSPN
ncbi:hypothetical protein U9M48_016940 [Paspalum notatum var. saurae]|uniref:PHD-type domain-containing protein n=1 Tax=Paspalum notatum var. saurae TaxID=547442 RepID=A0AAQ3WNT7_PASNO